MRQIPPTPTDDDIEQLVIDALERLPLTLPDQLGSVAIVIEEAATPEQLALGRGARPVRALPGRAADALVGRRRPDAKQDHHLPDPARAGQPNAAASGRRVADTVYHEIAHHLGISDGGSTSSNRERPDRSAQPSTTSCARASDPLLDERQGSGRPSGHTASRSGGGHRPRSSSGRLRPRARCRRCRRGDAAIAGQSCQRRVDGDDPVVLCGGRRSTRPPA